MVEDIRNRVAFVTGGARGIGRAVCEALLEKQVKVCIADVLEDVGRSTEKELQTKYGEANVIFLKCDVSSNTDFEENFLTAKAKFGHLDILINNAGVCIEDDWEKCIDVNLKGVMRGTTLAFKHLADKSGKQGGVVVNTASVLCEAVVPNLAAYCTSKFGVAAWTRCWGDEEHVTKTGVKVNAVCPGATKTAMTDSFFGSVNEEGSSAERLRDTCQECILQPSDIAKGFIKVLEEGKTGVLLAVTPDKGEYYVEIETYV